MNLTGKIALFLLPAWLQLQMPEVDKSSLLDRKLSFTVNRIETLESVLNRIEVDLGMRINFNTRQVYPFKARRAVYNNTPLRVILDEQLTGKPLSYRVQGARLQIVNVSKK